MSFNRKYFGLPLPIWWLSCAMVFGLSQCLVSQRLVAQQQESVASGGSSRLPITDSGGAETGHATAVGQPWVKEPRESFESRKLTPLKPPSRDFAETAEQASGAGILPTLVSMGSSLLFVLGLFFGGVWCYRKMAGKALRGGLPDDVVRVLGRTTIAARQQLVLVQFGSKLVLMSLIQGELRAVSEIQDPHEVRHLKDLCQGRSRVGDARSFRNILEQGA